MGVDTVEKPGRLWGWGLLTVLAVGLLTAWGWTGRREEPVWPPIIAHRAGAALGPENTLAALERAISAGAAGIEVDVRRTKDGTLILHHDESLARTTGRDGLVRETDWTELRELDAGSRYSAAFAGEPVPTLEQMLAAARGRVRLMLEVKEGESLRTVEETVALIQKAGMEEECILASGELVFLARSKGMAPGITTFYIGGTWDRGLLKLDWVDGYSLPLSALSSRTAADIHGAGKELWVWTVNTGPEAERAMELGADALVTDDPGLPLRDGGHLGQRAIW